MWCLSTEPTMLLNQYSGAARCVSSSVDVAALNSKRSSSARSLASVLVSGLWTAGQASIELDKHVELVLFGAQRSGDSISGALLQSPTEPVSQSDTVKVECEL